ncbi:hypothetical protein FB451DRAFT_1173648 [Mycena latifolia]|nr:hypothetical protein FB451DRAFT_1173648 [Mycena latifolia]
MSDGSFEPSSDGPGETWALSQQHHDIYYERKHTRHEERKAATQNKRLKLGIVPTPEALIKQESSPCKTPRPSAVKANELIIEQYAAALNSQMGENTFVDTLMESTSVVSRGFSPPLDGADIDLLRMQLLDAEAQRDDATEARDAALEDLAQMKIAFDKAIFERDETLDERDEVIRERDEALNKLREWNEAAVAAAQLAQLASAQVWISRGY